MFSQPYLIPIILAIYMFITYFANWKVRSKWMILFPFYALFQVLVLVWFGIFRYFETVKRSRNIGKIRMRHNPNNTSLRHLPYLKKTVKNYLTIATVVFGILSTSVGFFQKFIFGQTYEPLELGYILAQNVYHKMNDIGQGVAMDTNIKWGEEVFLEGQVAGASTDNEE